MKFKSYATGVALGALACIATASFSAADSKNRAAIEQAVSGSWRPAEEKSRDAYRHPADALEIADPWTRSVRPGGASADILRAYSFIPNYVIYPSPGCWALDVELGGEKTRVTLEIR